jgi:hypothetical protein
VAELLAVRVSVLAALPLAPARLTDAGLRDPVTPLGRPVAVRSMVPLKLLIPAAVIVLVAVPP